jgi:hypothetical protein
LTYGLTTTAKGVEAKVAAETRDDFYKEAVAATLEVAYGGTPERGAYEGTVVPIQAAGDDELAIVNELVNDCLLAVGNTGGTLHAPRWLSFDANRVTATLPATVPAASRRAIAHARVLRGSGASPYEARILFELGETH